MDMKRDFDTKAADKQHQMEMARNVGQLKNKESKRQQIHLLCQSLVRMIRGRQ
jgi:hypothetical protein